MAAVKTEPATWGSLAAGQGWGWISAGSVRCMSDPWCERLAGAIQESRHRYASKKSRALGPWNWWPPLKTSTWSLSSAPAAR